MLTSPTKDWLESNREALNLRFRAARKRFPKLDARSTLDAVALILPPLAEGDASGPLLHEIYDLILLHAGRGLFVRDSGLGILLSDTFPKLRTHLLARPTMLPASLSNAVEHLGRRGREFATILSALAPRLDSVELVLDAGAVLAWRLGEARLREQALAAAARLPGPIALTVLDLEGWPENAAPIALASLMGDAWHSPAERVTSQTLMSLARAPREKIVALIDKLSTPATMPLANWTLCSVVGQFSGFGGEFTRPPKLLNPGTKSSRHRFWVRSGASNYRIDADYFGTVCRLDPSADFPTQESPASAGIFKSLGLSLSGNKQMLLKDGTLHANGESTTLRDLAGASSFNIWPNALAAALDDSHRIHIYAPVLPAL